MNKTLLICATALLVASCSKETTETPEVPEAKRQGIIFSAAQDDDVRTKLDGVNILWQRGDAVGIFSEEIPEAVNYKAVIAEEDHDKQFATLHTDLNYNGSGVHTFYAYYPYVEVEEQTNIRMVKGSISASQNGDIGSNAFMWAKATVDPAANSRVDLHFKHPFTYLNIQLCATGEYQGATVEQIRLEAADGRTLAGDFEADLLSGDVYFNTHEHIVTVTPAATALGPDYLNTLVVVNAEDLTDSKLTVRVTLRQNGKTVKLHTFKAGRQLNPQTKVNLKLTAEDMVPEQGDDAIEFADDAVKAICVQGWDTNADGSLSYKEASEVQSLDWAFVQNANIASFEELQYFKGLTSIEESAFDGCNSLTSIVIPENVTSIGGSAFSGCTSLDNIIIPDNVASIGLNAFYGCNSLTSVVIPENVTSIGECAFENCSSLTSVVIPENVTSIGERTFSGCTSLDNIIIPDNVTSIGERAFGECSSLTSIVIPDKVTTLGNGAFISCNKLTDVTIGNRITTIPEYCFYGCGILANIVISKSVTSIGMSAFNGCTSLDNIIIPDNVTSIGDYAFGECSSLTSIEIPDKVTTLGNSVFAGCNKLADVTIGNGITTIPDGCFSGLISLANIAIPDNVTSIGMSAFSGCASLDNIIIPDNVTSIGDYAFSECVSLVDIVIPENVTSIGEQAFDSCSGLERVTLPDKLSVMGESVFLFCYNLETFNGKYASEDHRCLIQDGKLIAFAPASLTEYVIPESVTSIGNNVFLDCTELEKITIPDGVTKIEDYAFEGCTGITSVTISKNVTMIGERAFDQCPLTDVYCRALTPPVCMDRAFGKDTSAIKLYVPTESVELYSAKAGWKKFGQILGYNYGNL